ncbi:MAG TPA: hypothetical protein VKZ86_08535 [Cyclobacteriaceae bacterium]|nr:hypothetical protein [Cyclobacteriaceae bacterium]
MKTLIHRLGYGLVLLVIIVSCSQPESEEPVIDTSSEVVEVSGEYMTELMTAYKTFVENLSEEEKGRLTEYVNSLTERSTQNGRLDDGDVECRCLATQAHCSARSATTECCVCWDPATQVGVCGRYMGVAFCRTEERPTRGGDDKQPKPQNGSTTVRIYPAEMKNLVGFIELNKLGAGANQSVAGLDNFKRLLGAL